ncbi:MAG TPA: hypothetical protein VFG50_00425 [Rhodothermales bacterium]|nr:hypothetical protein [Rhodothermales bacterium]
MTQLMQAAIKRLAKLPRQRQDAIASRILEELRDEDAYPSATDRQWVGGHKPSQGDIAAAVAGLRAFRKGHVLDGLSIRDMIEEGRR